MIRQLIPMINTNRQKEIEESIIRVMSKLLAPIDLSKPNQSISPIGLAHMLPSIPREELIEVLKNMDGVHFLNSELQIPTKHFT